MKKTEVQFKHWFLKKFDGWSETYHPGRGSGVGIPDVQLLMGKPDGTKLLLPVELKIGSISGPRLYITKFAPSQVYWHLNFQRSGGSSSVAVGLWDEEAGWTAWDLPVPCYEYYKEWYNGWPLGETPEDHEKGSAILWSRWN